eukprot:COSAG01_NODE_36950_length_510_cov_1.248175_2_plen_27_part_01
MDSKDAGRWTDSMHGVAWCEPAAAAVG